jgi:hypothetical protein
MNVQCAIFFQSTKTFAQLTKYSNKLTKKQRKGGGGKQQCNESKQNIYTK